MTTLQQCDYILVNARGYRQVAKQVALNIRDQIKNKVPLTQRQLQVVDEIYRGVVEDGVEISLDWREKYDIGA